MPLIELLTMREDWLQLLMTTFVELLAKHTMWRETLGVL